MQRVIPAVPFATTFLTALAIALVPTVFAADSLPSIDESAYLSENDKAMTKMMKDMSIKPTGNVDEDFVAMMVPHHQGAIDMAMAELRHGQNEQLRRIAQEIVVEQQQEITAMRLALSQPLPSSAPSPQQQSAPAPAKPYAIVQPTSHEEMPKQKEP